jgi:hypothetical protein
MNWAAISQRVFKFVVQLMLASTAYWLLRHTVLYNFTAADSEGLNTLIQLVGSIFSVMYAFVIFVIWTQFTEVENFVMLECNALNDLLRFSEYVNEDTRRDVHRAVADYAHAVLKSEWRALADRRRDRQAEKAFSDIIDAVLSASRSSPAEESAFQRLTDIAQHAGQHRDERVAKSLTRIPPTLLRLVHTMALVLLLLIFIYPFHNWWAGLGCFTLLALVLFLANLVMEDTDNPFEGVCNVSPQPFSDLRP